jgi:hypothetical protein
MNILIFAAVASIGFSASVLWFNRGATAAAVFLVGGGYLVLFAKAHEMGVIGVLILGLLAGVWYLIPLWLGTRVGLWLGSKYRTQSRIRYGSVAIVFACLGVFGSVRWLQ